MQDHGIPLATLPVDPNGFLRQELFSLSCKKYLGLASPPPKLLRLQDPGSQFALSKIEANAALEPQQHDVLLGRGRRFQEHPGNTRLRQWVEDFRDAYDAASRYKRYVVARELKKKCDTEGVRFLKRLNGSWMLASDIEAEEKIKHLCGSPNDQTNFRVILLDWNKSWLFAIRATLIYFVDMKCVESFIQ